MPSAAGARSGALFTLEFTSSSVARSISLGSASKSPVSGVYQRWPRRGGRRGGASGSEPHGEAAEPPVPGELQPLAPLQLLWIHGESEAREALEQGSEGDFGFQPGQRRA